MQNPVKQLNFKQKSIMTRELRAKLVSPLLAAIAIVSLSALSGAQEPGSAGQTDPVGPPASYITLRTDNLALSYVSGANNVLDTYEAALNNPDAVFAKPLTSNNVPSAGVASSVSVAGRILSQDKDQLVIVGRSGSEPTAIKVRFALGGDYKLSNLHARLTDAPDQISVAAGDLDKIPDANGANHDELVVAYAENDGSVNVAVLNYSDPKASGSGPKYVTQTVAPFKVNLASPPAPFPVNGDQQGFKVSEVLALAIGDFDGDGQNEIALATFDPVNYNSVNLAMFRYVHPTLSAKPALNLVAQKTLFDFGNNGDDYLLPTISLAAGNFEGTGRADLVLAYREFQGATVGWYEYSWLNTYSFNGNFDPTDLGSFRVSFTTMSSTPLDTLTPGRIICLPGLVNYDPANGFNVYRRGVVVLYNDIQPADGDAGALLRVETYTANMDPDDKQFLDFTNLGGTITLPNQGIGASFAATVGGFGVDGNINNPVWSLAVEQVKSLGGTSPNQETVSLFQNVNGRGLNTEPTAVRPIDSKCPISVCDSTTQNALRPTIQAYDYQGRTVLLGAPIEMTVPMLISTDFVLQDPPTHAYWDEKNEKLVVVSRNAGTNVSLTNKQGITYSGKSTDTSASSVGGSASETASLSVQANVLGLFQTKFNAEETAKATYNYDQNQASYNSTYSSRTLTETGKTDADDFIDGRYQRLTIWRYRVLGETGEDSAGKPLNLYYDVVFPGTTLAFSGPGSAFDWYQPIHEPGNILSYPAPSSGTFSPADLGTFAICPAGATDCTPADTTEMHGPMIGNQVLALGGASQSKGYDYVDTSGHGIAVSYQKKLATSLDIKAGFSTQVGFFGGGEASFSESLNLNSSNSWGNTTTSDSTSSSETGITINVAAIGSTQGYNIYPTLYTTLDGTIKVAFAADPLGNGSGSSFWRGLYGALPDPALNLPLRFISNGSSWTVNDESSRKQMRGFFVQSTDPDPVTGQYDNLAQAPVAGQKVRISAQVYNYSTAQSFQNCLVQFCAIKYDSNSNSEVGKCQPIGQPTTISLAPRATASAWTTWDTKGFGPIGGAESQDYRIYVKLNNDKKINETYPPEDPNKIYAPGLAKGVDPGQNDEGFGLATVMASAPARPSRVQAAASSNNYSSPAVTFSSTPLVGLATDNLASRLVTNNSIVGAGTPLRVRAQVCSTGNSRDQVDVVVFDGEPSGGRVVAWKRIYVPGSGQCKSTWFNWIPSRGNHNLVATIEPLAAQSITPHNASLMSEASPKRASLQIYVP